MTNYTRYGSQLLMPEIGMQGQAKISAARLLVIGAGGLGCPLLTYATAAGVGTIGMVDDDKVSLSNLHRQVLYTENDIGKMKVDAAGTILSAMNSNLKFEIFPERIVLSNARSLVEKFDIVADCSDNIATRYLVDDVCARLQKPLIYAAIRGFEGQVSVFNYRGGPSFSHAFPDRTVFEGENDCAMAGILGTTAGVMGCLMANEALKVMLEMNEVLSGKVLSINLLTINMRKWRLKK
jgi:sulfur-carrier protein adenylyltransferase/sulfurtransferase